MLARFLSYSWLVCLLVFWLRNAPLVKVIGNPISDGSLKKSQAILTAFRSILTGKPQLLAGLPRARSARGTEPHTHGIWSTSFRLVVTWLTERTYVRTYASTDCTGGVGETIKRKGGVSQAWVLQVLIFYIRPCQYGQLTAIKTG